MNNDEKTLYVITTITNPINYKRRYDLYFEFEERMSKYDNVVLYTVELIYFSQDFKVTNENNSRHIQIKMNDECYLWYKENLLNIAIKKLPETWKYVAWIDADIEFTDCSWTNMAIEKLKSFDVIQLFEFCHNLDINKNIISRESNKSFASHCHLKDKNIYGHVGYAWAMTKEFYMKIGYIYDMSITGNGDLIFAYCLRQLPCVSGLLSCLNKTIIEYSKNFIDSKISFIPVTIYHHYHGSNANRQYMSRHLLLTKYNFDPETYLYRDNEGLLMVTNLFCQDFKNDLKTYFLSRKEDM